MDSYEYDAFGNELNHTGTTSNNYLYRGEQYDTDLSLYYLRARYYNPATGRFLSVDSEAGQGQRRYEYAGADPVNGMDPSGNEAIVEFALLQFYPGRLSVHFPGIPGWCGIAGGRSLSKCSTPAPGVPPPPCMGNKCPKHLVLDRTTFEPKEWGIHAYWTLMYNDGSKPDGNYYVMEQQSVHWLAHRQDGTISPSGRSYDYPNQFDDIIQTAPYLKSVHSLQSFAISLSQPNYDGWAANAMHVLARIDGTEYCGDFIHLEWGNSTQFGATCIGAQ
jgi:RHS repeat-associated protein